MYLDRTIRQTKRQRFDGLVRFLRRNRAYPRIHREYHVRRLCDPDVSARRKLHAIFCAAVSSDRGNNLNLRGEAVQGFLDATRGLDASRHISADEFMNCFGAQTIDDVGEWLRQLPGVGKKKTALFFRDLFVTQQLQSDRRIFSDRAMSRTDLLIPLDIVIANAWNRIFGLTFKSTQQVSSYFDLFNSFARSNLGNGRMVLEDLWYWGYFCFRNRTIKEAGRVEGPSLRRVLAFNRAKYLLDPAFQHVDRVPPHFLRFIDFVRLR